jgi:deazaflavin-dependent oxidoreductase (nitroreductase family)
MKLSAFRARLTAALGGVIAPVDYSSRTAYRRPPALYRHLQGLGRFLVSRGWVPDFVVMLEVRGRRSGRVRRTLLVRTVHAGRGYLVALAGESEWVRNVRAAAGRAIIRHGKPREVTLVEVPLQERPPIIREYLCGAGRRAGSQEAQRYFGVSPDPSLEEIRPIAEHYPVFEIVEASPSAGRAL